MPVLVQDHTFTSPIRVRLLSSGRVPPRKGISHFTMFIPLSFNSHGVLRAQWLSGQRWPRLGWHPPAQALVPMRPNLLPSPFPPVHPALQGPAPLSPPHSTSLWRLSVLPEMR